MPSYLHVSVPVELSVYPVTHVNVAIVVCPSVLMLSILLDAGDSGAQETVIVKLEGVKGTNNHDSIQA